MSTIQLPKVLTNRRLNSLDAEREQFEKSQINGISKAINQQETPVKTKHVRTAIIGTHHVKGATVFWNVVERLPLREHPIVSWKFCHTLHKVLREGHPMSIPDSLNFMHLIEDLGKLWGHLREGYGKLIALYCKLLLTKLNFHKRNPRFPGNLILKQEDLDDIAERDINNYFEITVEMFDYMEDILVLQHAVFTSLDMSRANSMTNSGQCRLSPLILCIQDSSCLYDYTVKLLFKLHSSLSPDTLTGHRDRFYKHYKVLRDFYQSCSTLQYFKNLIQVTLLPETPPNFLVQSELRRHAKPIVTIPNQSPDSESLDCMSLIDTSELNDVDMLMCANNAESEKNGALDAERDDYVRDLQKQLGDMRLEMQRLSIEYQRAIDDLKRQIRTMEMNLAEVQRELESRNRELEKLRKELSESSRNHDAAIQLIEVEKKAKASDEKFTKMKEVYGKLREEHINLIRSKAEVEKQVSVVKSTFEQAEKAKQEAEENLAKSRSEKDVIERGSRESANDLAEQLMIVAKQKDDLEQAKSELTILCQRHAQEKAEIEESAQRRIAMMERVLADNERRIHETMTERECMKSQMDCLIRDSSGMNESLKKSAENMSYQLAQVTAEKERLFDTQRNLTQNIRDQEAAKMKVENDMKRSLNELSAQLERVKMEKTASEKGKMELEANLSRILKEKEASDQTLQRTKTDLNSRISGANEEFKKFKLSQSQLENELTLGKRNWNDREKELNGAVSGLNGQVSQLRSEQQKTDALRQELAARLVSTIKTSEDMKTRLDRERINKQNRIFVACIEEAERIVQNGLDQFDNPAHSAVTSTPDYLIGLYDPVLKNLQELQSAYDHLTAQPEEIDGLVRNVSHFAHLLSQFIVEGKATSNTVPDIEKGDKLADACKLAGTNTLNLFGCLKTKGPSNKVKSMTDTVNAALNKIMGFATPLLSSGKNDDDVGKILDEELRQMEAEIEEAGRRISSMMEKSRAADSGVKLEVNSQVLDACTQLMQTIRVLVMRAKDMQLEIVAQGKGSASATEFYTRNNRWTEGLISAAKAVGLGAKIVVDAADKVVGGSGKFEELMVASQEIAASSAQLVFASKVKADRGSENMSRLSHASKTVSEATGKVVATAKNCSQLLEESDVMDFSKLSLHQAKRLEMEAQVKVLELESSLEKERQRLSSLRKMHHKLGGASEGWEPVEN